MVLYNIYIGDCDSSDKVIQIVHDSVGVMCIFFAFVFEVSITRCYSIYTHMCIN